MIFIFQGRDPPSKSCSIYLHVHVLLRPTGTKPTATVHILSFLALPKMSNPLTCPQTSQMTTPHHPPISQMTTQPPQPIPRLTPKLLHQLAHLPKLPNPRIAHTLIQKALRSRHHNPLTPQPRQRNRHLLRIATTNPIRQNINFMPLRQQIQRSLRDTDMAFDADDDHFALLGA